MASSSSERPSPSVGGVHSGGHAAHMPQQYCLRWNNHQHNLLSVFEDLLNSEAFVDVTLACEGLQLKAHKMVLSACSPYFQAMLYNTPDRHPIVFLRDVRYDEMKALLEFMYRGEVSVDQENLNSLLKVAEGLKIKGLAEVNDHSTPPARHMGLTGVYPGHGLLSPHALEALAASSPLKRMSSPPNPNPSHPVNSGPGAPYTGPRRKRARPRRLSGSESVPLASGLTEESRPSSEVSGPLMVQTGEVNLNAKFEKGLRERSGGLSPRDTKALDLVSEAESDGRNSGLLSPKKEAIHRWTPSSTDERRSPTTTPSPRNLSSPRGHHAHHRSRTPTSHHHEGSNNISPNNSLNHDTTNTPPERTGTKSFSEMSVRGLDLLRYATISSDGTYRCIECERVQITKNFKNKYSFQRHAFLYHEGAARKVFPCPICQKEFSRPDKMKSHLKTAHDCVIPKADNSSNSSSSSNANNSNLVGSAATASTTAATATAAVAAAAGSAAISAAAVMSMNPTLLVNPFLGMAPPPPTEGAEAKLGSLSSPVKEIKSPSGGDNKDEKEGVIRAAEGNTNAASMATLLANSYLLSQQQQQQQQSSPQAGPDDPPVSPPRTHTHTRSTRKRGVNEKR